MSKTAGFAALALAAAMVLAACSEETEERTPQEAAEAAEPQNTEFTGDIGAATQEAVSDTNAAASEAAVAGTTSAPAASDAAPATEQ
jgi:PBP1b-binding outer membrane lipoprotein LpoB